MQRRDIGQKDVKYRAARQEDKRKTREKFMDVAKEDMLGTK